jgi:hypothetical protein
VAQPSTCASPLAMRVVEGVEGVEGFLRLTRARELHYGVPPFGAVDALTRANWLTAPTVCGRLPLCVWRRPSDNRAHCGRHVAAVVDGESTLLGAHCGRAPLWTVRRGATVMLQPSRGGTHCGRGASCVVDGGATAHSGEPLWTQASYLDAATCHAVSATRLDAPN